MLISKSIESFEVVTSGRFNSSIIEAYNKVNKGTKSGFPQREADITTVIVLNYIEKERQ
jgi:hypothetical protein